MYWAMSLAEQTKDKDLQDLFTPIARQLADNENKIIEELMAVQGKAADLGGYYRMDKVLTTKVMRPSVTLNTVIDSL
jgi:isocitrate dehydrogenase